MLTETTGIRRFTAEEVLRMVEVGILTDADKVELLDGYLVEMSPEGPLHASVAGTLDRWLSRAYGDAYHVREAHPLLASVYSMPEPDMLVVRGDPRDYRHRHPDGTDCVLAVEISVTTQKRDARKSRIYAEAGVPVYWRLDLDEQRLIVESEPKDGAYTRRKVHTEGSVAVPGIEARLDLSILLDD